METQKKYDFNEAVKVQTELLKEQNMKLEATNSTVDSMTTTSAELTKALNAVNKSTGKQVDLLSDFIEKKNELENHFTTILEKSDINLEAIVKNKEIIDEIKVLINDYPKLLDENKELLLKKLADIYPTDSLIEVSKTINEAKNLLTKIDYAKEVEELSQSLIKYKEDIQELQDITKNDTDLITTKVNTLVEQFQETSKELSESKELTTKFIEMANKLNEKFDIIDTKLSTVLSENDNEIVEDIIEEAK